MKKTLPILSILSALFGVPSSAIAAIEMPNEFPLRLDDIRIRDPFILADADSGLYFLYAQTGNRGRSAIRGVEAYRSRDLESWSEPSLVFGKPEGSWGGDEIWAPEVHRIGDHWCLFVSFNGREGGRGTQIFRAESPAGPFEHFSDEACTPPEERCLDATPFVEADGACWLVYCQEWVQLGDGAMKAVRMKPDWSARVGEPIQLFTASEAPWVRKIDGGSLRPDGGFVTDGPAFHRTRSGRLLMLWSSFGEQGYAVGIAESDSGRIDGRWTQRSMPLFAENGGHCMTFETLDGRLLLALHRPNSGGAERARLFDLVEFSDRLMVRPYERVAGYLFAHVLKEDYARLYYSVSTDGRHWRILNDRRRILSDYLGHPDITRGPDGRFYLVGNVRWDEDLRFWASDDLVTWRHLGDHKLDVSKHPGFDRNTRNHGAPKLWFDESIQRFVVSWHSSKHRPLREKPEHFWAGQRTFYITSPDLKTFTEPARLFRFDMATIDTIIRRENGRYFALLKDELYPSFDWPTGKTIRISTAPALTGPWTEPGPPITPNFREAPALIPRPDGQGWFLYHEQYPAVQYGVSTAPTLDGPWFADYVPGYEVPEGARHGCMLALREEELQAILAAYDTKE